MQDDIEANAPPIGDMSVSWSMSVSHHTDKRGGDESSSSSEEEEEEENDENDEFGASFL